jgi:general secretion pathway protein J
MRADPRAAGFTLIEVLATLVVLGFLLAVLSQGVRFGLTAWQAQARAEATHGDLATVDQTVRALLERMEPGDLGAEPLAFAAGPDRLSFASLLPDGATALGARLSEVTIAADAAHRLVLLWRPYRKTPLGPPRPPGVSVLAERVRDVAFAYWDGTRGAWLSSWPPRTVPALVRMRVTFAPGDPRHWPDLVMAPMRDARTR